MKTIFKNSNQLPGLIKLIIIPVWNIKSISGNSVNVINTDFVFLIQTAIDTIQHDAELKEDDNGIYYEHQVSAFLPGDHVSNAYFDDLARHYVVVLLQTDNGSWIRLGDTSNALKLSYKYSASKPGYDLAFNAQLAYKSLPNVIPAY